MPARPTRSMRITTLPTTWLVPAKTGKEAAAISTTATLLKGTRETTATEATSVAVISVEGTPEVATLAAETLAAETPAAGETSDAARQVVSSSLGFIPPQRGEGESLNSLAESFLGATAS